VLTSRPQALALSPHQVPDEPRGLNTEMGPPGSCNGAADEDIKARRVKTFDSVDELMKELDQQLSVVSTRARSSWLPRSPLISMNLYQSLVSFNSTDSTNSMNSMNSE